MIINFSNLGGGGGGGYVLPTATETRLGGVKIGEGVAVDSAGTITVTGATNAQQKFIVNSESERDSLTGVSEGDVCTIAPHLEPAYDINYQFYEYVGLYGYDILGALKDSNIGLGSWNHLLKFQVIENPNYDTSYGKDNPSGASMTWYVVDSVQGYLYSGVRCNDQGVWQYLDAQPMTSDEYWQEMPASGCTMDFSVYSGSENEGMNTSNLVSYLWCEYPNSSNTEYQYALTLSVMTDVETFQYNNGQWIELATVDAVNSAMTVAQSAVNIASAKLDKTATWITDWSEVQDISNCWLEPVVEEGGQWVDKGAYLHLNGWSTEAQHKKVTELVTSPTVMRVLAMTQDEYDALATHDANTLYAIIPDNS